MRLGHIFSAVALVGGMSLGVYAHAGCKLQFEQHYVCDSTVAAKKLAEAKIIHVQTNRTDLFAADRTGQLVTKLGKQVAATGQPADMTFEVVPVDHGGMMDVGPHAIPEGRLNVYDTDHQLLWVETLDGDGDAPWTADVMELLKRFQAHVAGSKDL